MNYLLRTLTENSVKSTLPGAELRLLLTTVKDGRRQNTEGKLTDPFYESLEGLLLDLRTVTIDNHDAEAFLKPVTKTEVPDYYDIISNPMDLQTMMKKVKQKAYKSKREFKDDLDLIWNNCSTYNSVENHPLRLCAQRLKAKAERLLQSITDRKERIEPPISSILPPAPGLKLKINGAPNGHAHKRTLSSSGSNGAMDKDRKKPSYVAKRQLAPRSSSFAESLAIVRTPAGMVEFNELDSQLETASGDSSTTLSNKLREYIPDEHESDEEPSSNAQTGEKRRMNGIIPPRKRTKYESPLKGDDLCQLWWSAVQSDELFGNGIPGIPYGVASKRSNKRKKRKKSTSPLPQKALLNLMHANIRTLRRIRRTHAKYAALNLATSGNKDDDVEGDLPPPPPPPVLAEGEDDVEDNIDERPWEPLGSGIEIGERHADSCLKWANRKILEHAGFQGTSSMALDVLSGVASEYFLNIGSTLKFLTEKCRSTMTTEEIVLHTLFESGSKVQDLERYVTDDIERYGTRLGDLEKKLVGAYAEATAVESFNDEDIFEEDEEDGGELVMGNFADAIGDDFFGLRELGIADEFGLSSLTIPKRLLRGKRAAKPSEQKRREPVLPYPPPPPFIPVSSETVEDQIGLLQPYYQSRLAALAPPPPIPTPAPALLPTPATTTTPVPMFTPASIPAPPPPAATATPTLVPASLPTVIRSPAPAPLPPPEPAPLEPIVLPDDTNAPPGFMKLGPLGQVLKGSQTQSSKKKAKVATNPTPVVNSGGPQASNAAESSSADPNANPTPGADTPGAAAAPAAGSGSGGGGTGAGGGGAAEEGGGGKKGKKTKKKSNQDLRSPSQSNVLPPVVAASA